MCGIIHHPVRPHVPGGKQNTKEENKVADRIGIDQQAIDELTEQLNTVLESFNSEKTHFMNSIQETVNTPAFEGASAAAVAEFGNDLNNAYASINLEFEAMIQSIISAATAITEADASGATAASS